MYLTMTTNVSYGVLQNYHVSVQKCAIYDLQSRHPLLNGIVVSVFCEIIP